MKMKVIKNVLLCIAFLAVLFVGINLQHVNNEYSPAVFKCRCLVNS